MSEFFLSVGIDLGTTTTQLVFSRIEVENVASVASVPRIKIIDKKIIYRSGIYFTPLVNRTTIDTPRVRELVEQEYKNAQVTPQEVSMGAVIITGETARKENSEAALKTLSGLAGDFVVATAGSDLESILAGRGAGTAELSKGRWNQALVNLDIGGGTTNIAVFKNGAPVDTSCLDIGGRQIIVDRDGRLTYVAEKVGVLAQRMGLSLVEGKQGSLEDLEALCDRLADILAQSLGLASKTADLDLFITAHPLRSAWEFQGLTYSGGVADLIYQDLPDGQGLFPYGDIGALLGRGIRRCQALGRVTWLEPNETIRATVVGAGSNSMDISGSTIAWSDTAALPMQNIPIVKMTDEDEADGFRYFASRLSEKLSWFKDERGAYQQVAVGFRGVHNPSFDTIKALAGYVIEGMTDYLHSDLAVILIIDNDMAKSLGNSLMNALPQKRFIVLDNVKVENGDYIDIGVPVSQGRVIPVVVKTLIFGK